MSSMINNGKAKKWIPVVIALTAMVTTASFAIAPNTGQPTVDELGKKAILLGEVGSSTATGGGTVTNDIMWKQDCTITGASTFTLTRFVCTKHTAFIQLAGSKGSKDTFTINAIKCLSATTPTPVKIRGNVGSGALLDIIETSPGGEVTDIRLTDRPNEWIAKLQNCANTTDPALSTPNNAFKFEVALIKDGSFEFDFSVEKI